MSQLPTPGDKAPPFTLGEADERHAFDDVSAHPATLLIFVKRECATCDLTAPIVERLWRDAKLLEIGGGTLEAHHKNLTKDLSRDPSRVER